MITIEKVRQVQKQLADQMNTYRNQAKTIRDQWNAAYAENAGEFTTEQSAAIESTLGNLVTEMEVTFDSITETLGEVRGTMEEASGTLHKRWLSDDYLAASKERRNISIEINEFLSKIPLNLTIRLKEATEK